MTSPTPPSIASTSGSPRTFWALYLFFWLLFLVVFRSQPFSDPGALWHIRVGDVIFAHGFPHTDPFTWSYGGQPWIPQQWGAECLMSLLHRLGGFDALLVSMGALMAGLAAWIAKRFMDGGLHWMPAVALVSLGMAVAGFHFYLRPHLATIVLMAVVMAWIVDVDRGRIGWQRLYWIIPLCILWTNLHGGVLGGIFTFGLAIGGWLVVKPPHPGPLPRSGGEGENPSSSLSPASGERAGVRGALFLLAAIFLACILSTFVNPFGFDMHRTWFSIVGSDVLKTYIEEHRPLSLERSDGQAVAAFGAFYLMMLAGIGPRSVRVPWLIPLVWLALSWTSIRHGPLFVATALVALADFFPKTVWYRLLVRYGDTFAKAPAEPLTSIGWKGWSIPVALLLLAFGLQITRQPVPFIGYGWMRFDRKLVPDELIEPLQEYAKTKPDGHPIFNDSNLGGFLIYYTPNLKIFWDDRCELYRDKGLQDYVDTAFDHPERIEEWREKAKFDRALVDCDTALDKYFRSSPKWREVVRCKKAVLFERVE